MAKSSSRRLALATALIGTSLLAAAALAAEPDNSQILLDLLVKRGVLSSSDAAAYSKQIQASASAAPDSKAKTDQTAPAGSPDMLNVASPAPASPLSFKIGIADFTPFGFMDFTTVHRSTLNGGDIGSSFGSIPYGDSAAGQLSETRFSAKNSRLGLRVDSTVADTKVLGYLETDFLGNASSNINVASNSDVMRMRVYFVDLRKGDWEFLAGQDWSLMTPNRKGLSPLPSDIFYTQNVDTNYQVGLVWGRTPQLRAIYHATDELTMGLSLENPDQYVGSAVTLPAGFTTTQVDNGSNGTATPNVFPDVIGKIAYDTKLGDLPLHVDAASLIRYFKINTYTNSINSDASKTGFGGSINASVAVMPNLLLIANAFDGNDGGRYLSTGLGPDFIVNPPDASHAYSLSLVNSYAGMGGFEWDATPKSKIYAYYGMVKYGRKFDQLANGSYIGYGYPGSSNSNNKQIEEYTIGVAQTLWKNPSYGDLKVLLQASYIDRTPWYVAPLAASKAHVAVVYFDLRYDFP